MRIPRRRLGAVQEHGHVKCFIAVTAEGGDIGCVQVIRGEEAVVGFRFILDADDVPLVLPLHRAIEVLTDRDIQELISRDGMDRGGYTVSRMITIEAEDLADKLHKVVPHWPIKHTSPG